MIMNLDCLSFLYPQLCKLYLCILSCLIQSKYVLISQNLTDESLYNLIDFAPLSLKLCNKTDINTYSLRNCIEWQALNTGLMQNVYYFALVYIQLPLYILRWVEIISEVAFKYFKILHFRGKKILVCECKYECTLRHIAL